MPLSIMDFMIKISLVNQRTGMREFAARMFDERVHDTMFARVMTCNSRTDEFDWVRTELVRGTHDNIYGIDSDLWKQPLEVTARVSSWR